MTRKNTELKQCSAENCSHTSLHLIKGMCQKHYVRKYRNGKTTTEREMHGMTNKKEYQIWYQMISRCNNNKSPGFVHYGARGIKVCDRWRNSFSNFYDDMGDKPDGMSLDRIDNNGDYEPSNVKWRTPKQQSNNTRRNIYLTHDGKTMTIAEWADYLKIGYRTLYGRLYKMRMPLEQALISGIYNSRRKVQ